MTRDVAIERLGLACEIFLSLFFLVGFIAAAIGFFGSHPGYATLPQWSTVKPKLATFGIWAGTCGGLLAALDWFLPGAKKNRLKDMTVSIWVWLAAQKAGRFTKLLLSLTAQRVFAIVAHVSIAFIVLGFLAKIHGLLKGWSASFELGHPRIYFFQVWVDIAALALSCWLFGWWIYPRVAQWIAASPAIAIANNAETNTPQLAMYFKRAFGAYACTWLLLGALLVLQSPILYVMFSHEIPDDPVAEAHAIQVAFHGKAVVVALHAITAILSAPVMTALLMLQTLVFLSLYWIVLIGLLMAIFGVLRFFIERAAAGNQGPILTISALFVTVGAIFKIFL